MRQRHNWRKRIMSACMRFSPRAILMAAIAACGILSTGWAMAVGSEEAPREREAE